MNCLLIVGPLITGRRESEVKIRIRTYSDSITSVHQGAGEIEDYTPACIRRSKMWIDMLTTCICASHNLNLVVEDAMEAVTETRQFYDTIESVYNFFGHSIVQWQKLQNVHDRSCSNPALKA